ncbi:MAG: hypothetical protein Q9179_005403 [Wetmoreana sp. 5 TL-2023]
MSLVVKLAIPSWRDTFGKTLKDFERASRADLEEQSELIASLESEIKQLKEKNAGYRIAEEMSLAWAKTRLAQQGWLNDSQSDEWEGLLRQQKQSFQQQLDSLADQQQLHSASFKQCELAILQLEERSQLQMEERLRSLEAREQSIRIREQSLKERAKSLDRDRLEWDESSALRLKRQIQYMIQLVFQTTQRDDLRYSNKRDDLGYLREHSDYNRTLHQTLEQEGQAHRETKAELDKTKAKLDKLSEKIFKLYQSKGMQAEDGEGAFAWVDLDVNFTPLDQLI